MSEESEQRAFEELRVGFTAAVSHELRTPLARILALLESMEWEDKALLTQVRGEIEQMRELIDEILFLSELEAGHEVVALTPVSAIEVIHEVFGEMKERSLRAGVALRAEGDEAVTLPVRARMLKVLIENLAANALRYAGPGAVFTLSVYEEDGAGVLRGSDNGGGADSADIPRLFERFYRGDLARSSSGTGLGLAIVKHIVHAAGGVVGAQETPGGGLTITCSFRS